jgi:hypothetical protein
LLEFSQPEKDEICVVAHVARGGAQVDDGRGKRARLAKRVNVRHHVMPTQNAGRFLQQKTKQVLIILLS